MTKIEVMTVTKAEIIEQPGGVYLIARKHRDFKTYFPRTDSLRRLEKVLAGQPRMMNGRIFYRHSEKND